MRIFTYSILISSICFGSLAPARAEIPAVKDFTPPHRGFHAFRRDRLFTQEVHVFNTPKGFVCQSESFPYLEKKQDPLTMLKEIKNLKEIFPDAQCLGGRLEIVDSRDSEADPHNYCFDDAKVLDFWKSLKKACSP